MKRYEISCDMESPLLEVTEYEQGQWVKYEDHAAEVAKLRETIKRFMTLAFEIPIEQYGEMAMPISTMITDVTLALAEKGASGETK